MGSPETAAQEPLDFASGASAWAGVHGDKRAFCIHPPVPLHAHEGGSGFLFLQLMQ